MTDWQARAEAAETALKEVREERNQALVLERRRREELVEVRELLRRLANEASGFLSMADVNVHGVTNMNVLKLRIDEAKAVLSPSPAPAADPKEVSE